MDRPARNQPRGPPPPLPTWEIGDSVVADDEADGPRSPRERAPGGHIDATPTQLASADVSSHSWASVSDLEVSVSGQHNRVYYLDATGRTAGVVAHWRQGPYEIFDESVTLVLVPPDPLVASVQELGKGTLMVRVVSTTLDGVPFPQEVVGRTVLVPEEERIAGLSRERWAEVLPEQPLSGVEDAQPASHRVEVP